jgi:threonine synthase
MNAVSLTHLSHLECFHCHKIYEIGNEPHTFAACCSQPLVARYGVPTDFLRKDLVQRQADMWRYFEMLPVGHKKNIVSMGEGMTPLLTVERLRGKYELPGLYLKDESNNPTGSFKARGLSVAVSKAKEYSIERCILSTAGNAGGAVAAYCAAAGIQATVVMPRHTPAVFKQECELYNAELILVDGLISDCGRRVMELKKKERFFDLSTLKEPFRLEGKKTLGYEIAEQFNWQLPDVIIYPTGGGTGLIGIWKAFHEMIAMGWIAGRLPKMIAVQSQNCDPIVKTWNREIPDCKSYIGNPSVANGLAVPNPFGEQMILQVLEASKGIAIAVKEEEIIKAVKEVSKVQGLLIAPEGAAVWAALLDLLEMGLVKRAEKILLLNTGSGYKYLENLF